MNIKAKTGSYQGGFYCSVQAKVCCIMIFSINNSALEKTNTVTMNKKWKKAGDVCNV